MSLRYDLLIRNALIIDGARRPRFAGDIGVRAGRIADIGLLAQAHAEVEIDALGKIAAPGFIDAHTHDDRLLGSDPAMTPKVSQGVTSVVIGNCGISLAPLVAASPPPPLDLIDDGGAFRFPDFASFLEELEGHPAATNAACLVGHTTLRVAAMSRLDRAANPAETQRMQVLAREALAAGAIGLSTGTFYPPAAQATTEEIIAVAQPLKEYGGRYVTHMRNEDDRIAEAMEESFRIGREVGVPVVISHHKVMGPRNHGRSAETLALIARAGERQSVCLDCYPYAASSTMLRADRVALSSRVLLTWCKPRPEFAGMELAQAAARLGLSQEQAVAALSPAGAIYFSMDEADVQRILQFDETMIGSDGLPHDAKPHPRLWGTFARVLGHYCRDLGLFPLETAIYKMTGLTARNFGLKERGLLQPGYWADITLFDAGAINDTANFDAPTQKARGIDSVIVNGVPVWRQGKSTGARPGRVLRAGSAERATKH
ncbi:MAG: D-aminoacylase [Burkholderiales bacterium]|nr:D-aminoacylase [Burkholderiales bacterium]